MIIISWLSCLITSCLTLHVVSMPLLSPPTFPSKSIYDSFPPPPIFVHVDSVGTDSNVTISSQGVQEPESKYAIMPTYPRPAADGGSSSTQETTGVAPADVAAQAHAQPHLVLPYNIQRDGVSPPLKVHSSNPATHYDDLPPVFVKVPLLDDNPTSQSYETTDEVSVPSQTQYDNTSEEEEDFLQRSIGRFQQLIRAFWKSQQFYNNPSSAGATPSMANYNDIVQGVSDNMTTMAQSSDTIDSITTKNQSTHWISSADGNSNDKSTSEFPAIPVYPTFPIWHRLLPANVPPIPSFPTLPDWQSSLQPRPPMKRQVRKYDERIKILARLLKL